MKGLSLLLFALSLAAQEPILRIPPARVPLEIEHQPVMVTASGTVSSSTRPDSYSLSLSADLSDLQGHVTEILRAALDRSDECGERIAILGARLVPEERHAMLTSDLHLERWACGKAFGKAIKKRVVAGNGTVRLVLTPALVSPTQTRLDAEVRDITADGTLGELLRSGSLGNTLREKIQTSVQSALDKATDFRATLPPALQDLLRLREVLFGDSGGGHLVFRVQADAVISGDRLQQLRGELGRK
jgi:hypothetical protein